MSKKEKIKSIKKRLTLLKSLGWSPTYELYEGMVDTFKGFKDF
jgi:nucleoside-diphosphate-sugar epimerase